MEAAEVVVERVGRDVVLEVVGEPQPDQRRGGGQRGEAAAGRRPAARQRGEGQRADGHAAEQHGGEERVVLRQADAEEARVAGEVLEGQFTQCWSCGTERPPPG